MIEEDFIQLKQLLNECLWAEFGLRFVCIIAGKRSGRSG